MAQLEGDIFVRNRRCPGRLRLRCTLVEVVGCATRTATVTLASSAAFGSSAKQNQIVGYDFRHVLLLIGLLVVPGARLQPALDVDLAALLRYSPAISARRCQSTTLCHSVRSCHAPLLSLNRSLVATVIFATAVPCGVYFTS